MQFFCNGLPLMHPFPCHYFPRYNRLGRWEQNPCSQVDKSGTRLCGALGVSLFIYFYLVSVQTLLYLLFWSKLSPEIDRTLFSTKTRLHCAAGRMTSVFVLHRVLLKVFCFVVIHVTQNSARWEIILGFAVAFNVIASGGKKTIE